MLAASSSSGVSVVQLIVLLVHVHQQLDGFMAHSLLEESVIKTPLSASIKREPLM